jgi:hypothetical protein
VRARGYMGALSRSSQLSDLFFCRLWLLLLRDRVGPYRGLIDQRGSPVLCALGLEGMKRVSTPKQTVAIAHGTKFWSQGTFWVVYTFQSEENCGRCLRRPPEGCLSLAAQSL